MTIRELRKLKRLFWEWLTEHIRTIPRPLTPSITLFKEEMIKMLTYKLTLPPATAPDVVKWELGTTVGTDAESVAETTDGSSIQFNDGDQVSLRVRETDSAGNVSEWSDAFSFTAADTLPPSQPGAPSVTETADA